MKPAEYPEINDAFIDQLLADIERLGQRDYAEVGVPMFLVAEDTTTEAGKQPATSSSNGVLLATAFAQIISGLESRKPELDATDIAKAVEVLADRYFLAFATQPFSQIPTLHTKEAGN